jgi:hypothetical protein
MNVTIYKNTNFGNNDLVWNVPNPSYNFDLHEKKDFTTVDMRFPLLTTMVTVQGNYDFNTAYYDYMIITNKDETKTYYFINSIVAERNTLLFSVTLDAITTHNILSKPITGVIVRKHDTNPNEKAFDYPTALNYTGNYSREYYSYVGYSNTITRFIESAIDLSAVNPSVNIPTDSGQNIVIPILPKPKHSTNYEVTAWSSNKSKDESRAFTLYLSDTVNENVLNTVRGLSGDGAISDSYTVPTEAITIVSDGAEVTKLTGKFVTKVSDLKLEIDDEQMGFVPQNEATRGLFTVAITSIQEKTKISFPAWDLQESVNEDGYLKLNLWCDPKPSGAPYCCPDQVLSLFPSSESGIITLATLEIKSVRGGQWLRSPLIYSSKSGEIFSTVETQLQREKNDFERSVSLQKLEMSKRERDIRIAQADYNYESGLASNLLSGAGSLLSGDISGLLNQGKSVVDNAYNKQYVDQLRALQSYEQQAEKTLINMAHSNNLKNLNVQETIRRIVPREVVNQSNESLGSYEEYNGFTISLIIPDVESLQSKDMEFSKYGYPVYEAVNNFVILDHLRQNHTVYQFESPLIELGGKNGDMIREVLQSGIRVLNKPYTSNNILNNPKVVIV